jgi:hypothetical protein
MRPAGTTDKISAFVVIALSTVDIGH